MNEILLLWTLMFLICIAYVAMYRNHYDVHRHRYSFLRHQKWQQAHLRRKEWLEENQGHWDGDSPEYERLWQEEIGAEAIMQIFDNNDNNARLDKSYREYRKEKNGMS